MYESGNEVGGRKGGRGEGGRKRGRVGGEERGRKGRREGGGRDGWWVMEGLVKDIHTEHFFPIHR